VKKGTLAAPIFVSVFLLAGCAISPICLNSEYFLDAAPDPKGASLYFVTAREVLINSHPPSEPDPVRCELFLEKMRLDGTGRTVVMPLQTNRLWSVDINVIGNREIYLAPATFRFHLSPSGQRAVFQALRGRSCPAGTTDRVYGIDLVNGAMYPIGSTQQSDPSHYYFEAWSPNEDRIVVRQKWEGTRPTQGGGAYVLQLSNQVFTCNLDGSHSEPFTNQFPVTQHKKEDGAQQATVIADKFKGLLLVDSSTQRTKVLLKPVLNRRSFNVGAFIENVKSQGEDAKAYREYQDKIYKDGQAHLDAQRRAGLLGEQLAKHETNALLTAKSYLWNDHDLCCETYAALVSAKWDAADELVNDFLLHGPIEGGCKAWVVNNISYFYSDRFSDALLQIATDYSPANLGIVEAVVPGVGRMQPNAKADTFLVNVALKCPDVPIRHDALRWLKHRNKTLYSETMQKLANDKEFSERLIRPARGR